MYHIQEIEVNDCSHFTSIAFGTVNVKGAHGLNDVLTAIEAGYRLIDTSTNYNNEGMVGEAIRRSSVPREELMISSKLPGAAHSYDKAIQMIQESLYRSEEHTSELQSRGHLVCRLLLEKKNRC